MAIDETRRLQCQQSLDRCTSRNTFVATFYRRFFASSDEIASRFASSNMAQLRQMLKTSLYGFVHHTHDARYRAELEHSSTVHEKRSIAPWMFDNWRDAMIATVAEFDPQYDNELAAIWREVLDEGIAIFLRRSPHA